MGWFDGWFGSIDLPQRGRDNVFNAKSFLEAQLRAVQRAEEGDDIGDESIRGAIEALDAEHVPDFFDALERSATRKTLREKLKAVHGQVKDGRVSDAKQSLEEMISRFDALLEAFSDRDAEE